MFDLGGDDVGARSTLREKDAFQGVVVRFATAASEYHLARSAVEQRGDLAPGLVHCLAGGESGPMLAGRVAERLHQDIAYRRCHFWSDWSRGVEVEVNASLLHSRYPFTPRFILTAIS
jgi:hypothetical protein